MSRSQRNRRARTRGPHGLARLALAPALALAFLLAPAAGARVGAMRSADERAAELLRLPAQEQASEFWELAGRFDSGHLLFARVLVTNVGPGEHNAIAQGQLVDPDGSVHRFRKAKAARDWRLSDDGRRMEIGGSVVFDLREGSQRFRVDRDGTLVDLRFTIQGSSTPARALTGEGFGFDLLDPAADAQLTLRSAGMSAPLETRGFVALTHRWMPALEGDLVQRRLEFFSLRDDAPFYFTEVTAPDGRRVQWLVFEQGGRRFERSDEVRATLSFAGAKGGAAQPQALDLSGPGLRARVGRATPLLRDEPFTLLPLPARLLLGLRMQNTWSTAPFELTLEGGSGGLALRSEGVGLTNVTYFDVQPAPVVGRR